LVSGQQVKEKRVLIADDHAIFRAGLRQIIAGLEHYVVADEVDNGWDAVRKVRDNKYDIVILDISLPGRNGLDVLADINRRNPKPPVLVLSMYPEAQFGLHALHAGAAGYLTKGVPVQEVVLALQRIGAGKRYISPSLAEVVVDKLDREIDRPRHENLSPREYQIACLISAGKKPQQIAEDLAMSVKTIGTYRSRILLKMSFSSNAELIRYMVGNGLI
jgi:two-component system invasion response regulator UvrY